jgi:hypothetical protein
MFRTRISTAAAFTALAVAVLGATPVGHAAGRLVPRKHAVGTAQPTKSDALAHGARFRSVPLG